MAKDTVEFDYYETPDGLRYFSEDQDKRFALIPANGWGMPEIFYRTQRGATAKRQRVVDFEAQERVLIWDHLYTGCSRCEFWSNQYTMADLFRPDRVLALEGSLLPGKLVKRLPDGKEYYVNAYISRGPQLNYQEGLSAFDLRENLSFIAFDPYVYSRDITDLALATADTILDTRSVLVRDNCIWHNALGGVRNGASDGRVTAAFQDTNGSTYMTGIFDTAGGAPSSINVVEYDNAGNWLSLGAGLAGPEGKSITVARDGKVYVGGDLPAFNNLAVYDPGTGLWTTLAGGVDDPVFAVELGLNQQKLFVGGQFLNVGPAFALPANRIAVYDLILGTWSAIGTGLTLGVPSTVCAAIHQSTSGQVDVMGRFQDADGIVVDNFVVYDPFANQFRDIQGVTDSGGNVFALSGELNQSGTEFFMGGVFDAAGGIAMDNVGKYNGQRWSPLGNGLNDLVNRVRLFRNRLYAVGRFTASGDQQFSDKAAVWTGGVWTNAGFDTPDMPDLNDMVITEDRIIVMGEWGTTGTTSRAAACNLVTTVCNAPALPVITITAPSTTSARIYSIINETTDVAIFFSIELVPTEVLVLDMSREPHENIDGRLTESITFISNIRGGILGQIQPGSKVSMFNLQPGENVISVFAEEGITVSMRYRCRFWSMADCEFDPVSGGDLPCIEVNKEVSIDGGSTWHKFICIETVPPLGTITADYRATVTNCSGTVDLTDVTIEEAGGTGSWVIGNLNAGASQTISLGSTVIPNVNGAYNNEVVVTGKTPPGAFVGDSSSASVGVSVPSFPGAPVC